MQLTGHLKGRALEEWSLLSLASGDNAMLLLRERQDPGSKVLVL
jgi:hypothetical protein